MEYIRAYNHMEEMTEIRCKKCNRLLLKVGEHELDFASAPFFEPTKIEIKCPKCNYVNNLEI